LPREAGFNERLVKPIYLEKIEAWLCAAVLGNESAQRARVTSSLEVQSRHGCYQKA
jgi:hypothetical protein